MNEKKQSLGQLELEVLKIVWDKQGCSVPEAAEVLTQHKGYARTTVLTIFQRLHKKGFLERKKQAGVFCYYPTQQKNDVLGNLAHQFVSNIFEGSPSGLVQHLTETNVSPEELSRMRQIIDDAMSGEGEQL